MYTAESDASNGEQAGLVSVDSGPYGYQGKRSLDLLAAVLFLIVFSPLMVLVALLVWRSSPGQIIYSQERIGFGGRPFKFYKFRTMRQNSRELLEQYLAENPEALRQWSDFQKVTSDPRVTPIGRWLRRTSLDELPQLWNVVRGDMSMVGPRPCMPEQRALYKEAWVQYCSVRPGLTGLWQVAGRNKLTYNQRVELDAEYVSRVSMRFDISIILRTVGAVLRGTGSN